MSKHKSMFNIHTHPPIRQLSDRLRIKVRETVDRYQFRYQLRNVTRRIYPRNYAELFRQFGFNMGLLVLAEPVQLNAQTRPACWAHEPFERSIAATRGVRCYVDSLENKNGRLMERREPVTIFPTDHCQRRFAEQGRGPMFFPKSSLCAGRPDESDIDIVCDAYLVCKLKANRMMCGVHPVPEWCTVAVHLRDGHWLSVRSARHAGLVGGDQQGAASVRQRQQLS